MTRQSKPDQPVGGPDPTSDSSAYEPEWWQTSAAANEVVQGTPQELTTSQPTVLSQDNKGRANLFTRNGMTIGILAGLIAGACVLGSWMLADSVAGSFSSASVAIVLPLIKLGLVAAISTATIAVVPELISRKWWRALITLLIAPVLGLTIMTISLAPFIVFANSYSPILSAANDYQTPAPTSHILWIWVSAGFSCGLSSGILGRSLKASLSGLVGGALGGLAGGMLFLLTSPKYVLVDSNGQGNWTLEVGQNISLALAMLVGCVAIGFSIGLAERVVRSSWLSIIEGPGRGREFVLAKARTTLGSSPSCSVRLSDQLGIAPKHATVSLVHGKSIIHADAPLEINGQVLDTGIHRKLKARDVLKLGGVFIRFEEKE